MAVDVLLDISRLLSRIRHQTPSGVDRVEMAYARGLLERFRDQLDFVGVHPFGIYGTLPRSRILRFLDATERRWTDRDEPAERRSLGTVFPELVQLMPELSFGARKEQTVYVQASPHHLTNISRVRSILKHERARFLCLVHDLIPIEYPEYARPGGAALHRKRIETIVALAESIVVNSTATGASLRPWLKQSGRSIDVRVALLGTHPTQNRQNQNDVSAPPYFLCIGTIEPRKNHLLLLNLWRHMVEAHTPGSIPRLIIVGRRGWENEQIVDMLERCPALLGYVDELNDCADRQLNELLAGARAVLLPSFAEGYGMPVAEALAAGTPVICSDLPALREAGGDAPDFLDPLDGLAWKAHILDYAAAGSRYLAQMRRLKMWCQPVWADHMGIVCDAVSHLQQSRTSPTSFVSAP